MDKSELEALLNSTQAESKLVELINECVENPSTESWLRIVEIGREVRRADQRRKFHDYEELWSLFEAQVGDGGDFKHWPPEIERLCPVSWPSGFRGAVENRVLENDTYEHYVAKICGDPRLQLSAPLPSGNRQAVWLERRFTGGVVPVSVAQIALRSIAASLKAPSVAAAARHVEAARNVLSNGVRRVGKVGCADLTGGLVVEQRQGYCGEMAASPNTHCCRAECFANLPIHRREYHLEIEVKVGKQAQEPAQITRMQSVRARGGCYILARSVEEAVLGIIEFRARLS